MRCVLTFTFLLVFSIVSPAIAQNDMTTHQHLPELVIDGAVNPDKIPDTAAYRLYLLSISKSSNPNEKIERRVTSHLNMVGLQQQDLLCLSRLADNFNYQYHNLINSYNEAATAAWKRGERTDINSFLLQRDELVKSTMITLKNSLSADGWSRLNGHVQNEKTHMKISAQEAGQ